MKQTKGRQTRDGAAVRRVQVMLTRQLKDALNAVVNGAGTASG